MSVHAEGFDILSKVVLSQAMGCTEKELRKEVLAPLADEAIISTGGTYVLSRHRKIAELGREIIDTELLSQHSEDNLVDLAEAAIAVRKKGYYVPVLDHWDYQLPEHFLSVSKNDLAVRIAQKMSRMDSSDVRLATNLAHIFRRIGEPALGIEEFRRFSPPSRERPFLHEWATSEMLVGNDQFAILLLVLSSSDLAGPPLSANDVARAIMTMDGGLRALIDNNNIQVCARARPLLASLGLRLKVETQFLEEFKRTLLDSSGSELPATNLEEELGILKSLYHEFIDRVSDAEHNILSDIGSVKLSFEEFRRLAMGE